MDVLYSERVSLLILKYLQEPSGSRDPQPQTSQMCREALSSLFRWAGAIPFQHLLSSNHSPCYPVFQNKYLAFLEDSVKRPWKRLGSVHSDLHSSPGRTLLLAARVSLSDQYLVAISPLQTKPCKLAGCS